MALKKNLPVFEDWKLTTPNFKRIAASLREMTAKLKEAKTGLEALEAFNNHAKLNNKLQNQITHLQVLFTLNSESEEYRKLIDLMDEQLPPLQVVENEFTKALLENQHRAFLEKKLGTHLFTMYEFSLKAFDERIVEESIQEGQLSTQYGAALASIRIPFRGQEYNAPQMGKFLQDVDRETRKEASEAYYTALEAKAEELEGIYDKLVKVRDAMAKKLGFENYIELGYIRMQRYDYNAIDVAKYRSAIARYVTPIAAELMEERFKRTGIQNPEIYDMALAFPEGNALPKGDVNYKIESAKKMYDEMSPKTSEFFRYLADHHLLDLEARPGKQPGGYMTYFPVYGVPFIFSNFNGTSGDIDVLTHEFGHAFQSYLPKTKISEYRQPTSEACEVHSMSMEFFAYPWMDLFFDQPEKYRYSHLDDAISFLPYGATVDAFQEWVYAHPNATPDQRDAEWHKLEMKFTPYKVATYKDCKYMAKGRRWLTQAHIFENPFYYIDYTLAQVMAFQYFNKSRKNPAAAWRSYMRYCKMGGQYPFRTLVKKAGMKDPFSPRVVKSAITPLLEVLHSYKIEK